MKLINILILFCCLSYQMSAQSKTFHLGLKLEFYTYTYRDGYSPELYVSPLPSFHVVGSLDLSESIYISCKPGILFRPYEGFELGVFLNKKFTSSDFFVLGGVNLDLAETTVPFIVVGAGWQFTERLSADISFHQALDGEFAQDRGRPLEIFNKLKIGIAAML